MTKEERLIVSAYTGYLMCSLEDYHEFIEKLMGRPVYTHEMGNERFYKTIKDLVREDFIKIAGGEY